MKLLPAGLLIASVWCSACQPAEPSASASPDATIATMYYGGDIITMEGDSAQYAEAVVVKDSNILFVGTREEAMKVAGNGHQMVDLQGKTMVPGFFDGHAHFLVSAHKRSPLIYWPAPMALAMTYPACCRP